MIKALRYLDRKGLTAALAAMAVLMAGIAVGSRNLLDYDPALLTYTFGALFSAFAITYRYVLFLQRPPTKMYWRRGWQLLFTGNILRNVWNVTRALLANFVGQRFIFRRSTLRWFAHFMLSWGSIIAGAVTFPLVFGWVHFEARPDDDQIYQVMLFGVQVDEFHLASLKRYLLFNLLNISAVMVIVGVVIALHRRLKAHGGSLARQQFGNDLVPLILLLAVSLTGLMLTFSTHALQGFGYSEISLIHALTVTITLIYLPFGKLFHLFVRPAHLSVELYKRANAENPPAVCRICGDGFAGAMHVEDLKTVLSEAGLPWAMEGPVPHYAEVCPRCRRRLLGASQKRIMEQYRAG